MGGFGHQHTRWSGSQRAISVMPQSGGGLYESQLPPQTVDNSASYTQQCFPNEQTSNPYTSAPGGYGQQHSPDVQLNNPYFTIYGENGGIQTGGQDRFGFSSESSASTTQHQQHNFLEEHVVDLAQHARTSDAQRGQHMDSSFVTNPDANPFAGRAPHTSSYDTQGGGSHQYAINSGAGRGMQKGGSFAMRPGANQFTQFGSQTPDANMSGQYAGSSNEYENSHVAQQLTPYVQTNYRDAIDFGSNSLSSHNNITNSEAYTNDQSSAISEVPIKREHSDDEYVPGDVAIDDAVDEDTSQQPGKKRKINKNGRVRKVREPRGHLRRWDESDVSRALMGIVWACGENGVVIPFAQAAKIVDQDCTSGALQQAILKMHDKMNRDGAQLPRIKMNWPKKPSAAGKSIIRDNGKVPRKKPTLTQATQCTIVSLPAQPRDTISAAGEAPQQDLVLPMDVSYSGQSASADVRHERADEMPSSPRQLSDLPPSTPAQHHGSPICPPAPRHPTVPRRVVVDASTGGAAMPNRRFLLNDASSSSSNFAQQRATGLNLQQGLSSPEGLRDRHLQQGRVNTTQLGPLAAFNAEFEQHSTSASLAQLSASSNMGLDMATPRNATSSDDIKMLHSPMSGGSQADDNPQDVSKFHDMQSSFFMGELFPPSGSSSINDLSPGLRPPFTPGRRDSAFGSSAQSASSSQGSTGHMNRSTRDAQHAFQSRMEAAAAERPMTSMPSRTKRTYYSLQQPRQQLSLGLDTLSNPFGGTFGDASGGPFPPTHPSGGDIDDPFGLPSTTDEVTDFESISHCSFPVTWISFSLEDPGSIMRHRRVYVRTFSKSDMLTMSWTFRGRVFGSIARCYLPFHSAAKQLFELVPDHDFKASSLHQNLQNVDDQAENWAQNPYVWDRHSSPVSSSSWRVTQRFTRELATAKVCEGAHGIDDRDREMLMFSKANNHGSIVRYHMATELQGVPAAVTDMHQGMISFAALEPNLSSMHQGIRLKLAADMFRPLFSALEWLHYNRIIHASVAPPSVLVQMTGEKLLKVVARGLFTRLHCRLWRIHATRDAPRGSPSDCDHRNLQQLLATSSEATA
ncbi:hypothetical protein DPSP01_010530 [Paraphaeosphaeria sporulosa]